MALKPPRMSDFDIFRTRCADWAKGLEILSAFPSEGEHSETIEVEKESSGLAVTILSPDSGYLLPSSEVTLTVTNPDGEIPREEDSEGCFAHFYEKELNVLVVNNPLVGEWKVTVASSGRLPFSLNLSVFKSRSRMPGSPGRVPPPGVGSPGGPPHCRACKMTAKGLALAIVAAASLATLPHALVVAVAAYLGGVGTAIATAFIASVLSDSASVIAEKLCKAARLC
jgi:hypothetical protein